MTDKHDEQAEKLLPCDCDGPGHWNCAAIYRPAIAAALREKERELRIMQEEKDDLKSELEKIKSELADKEWELERQERAYRRRFP